MIDMAVPKIYYYHFDGLGSVVALSDVNKAIVETYDYDAFGQVTIRDAAGVVITQSAYDNPYMFTSRRLDNETDLYYYRARHYNPEIGRFLQTDPLGYVDSMNLYTYCGNNPVNWVDPWGLEVYVCARRLNTLFGGVGVHTYIEFIPDNPGDFGGKKRWVIGGYKDGDTLKAEKNNEQI